MRCRGVARAVNKKKAYSGQQGEGELRGHRGGIGERRNRRVKNAVNFGCGPGAVRVSYAAGRAKLWRLDTGFLESFMGV